MEDSDRVQLLYKNFYAKHNNPASEVSMFTPARRRPIALRMLITGVTGSGKTYTALKMATRIADGGRIAVISTDGTAHLYAGEFSFDCCRLPNNHPTAYIEAIRYAVEQKYEVLIIDSFSDEWAGPGGVLEVVDQAKLVGKDGWQETRKPQAVLADLMATAPIHLIATCKADEMIAQTVGSDGKPTTIKLAGKLVQNKDVPYNFDIIFALGDPQGATVKGVVEKTRNPALKGLLFENPGSELAGAILAWLAMGASSEGDVVAENPTQPHALRYGEAEAQEMILIMSRYDYVVQPDLAMVILGGLEEYRKNRRKPSSPQDIISALRALEPETARKIVRHVTAQVTNTPIQAK